MLGNGKVEVLCFDGEKRTAHIRGKMRKKVCPAALSSALERSIAFGLTSDVIILRRRSFC